MKLSNFNTQSYQLNLSDKINIIRKHFPQLEQLNFNCYQSSIMNYRLRAEFRVWHNDDALDYIVFDPLTKEKIIVDTFPTASKLINQAMPLVLAYVKQKAVLRNKLFQIDFLSTLSGELLISLLYHKSLDASWLAAAKIFKQQLQQSFTVVDIIGRARKQKLVVDRDYVIEQITLQDSVLKYQQFENSFTQPNGVVAPKMLEWARNVTANSSGSLLELYCGNGNFAIALADNFEQVLATEISKSSVAAALYNINLNRKSNIKVARLAADEFTQAFDGVRVFRRLQDSDIDIKSYNFSTILIDPPRSGVDIKTLSLVARFDKVIYISCNINTLLQNLSSLKATHKVEHLAFFDQFPYTDHLEIGVVLTKLT